MFLVPFFIAYIAVLLAGLLLVKKRSTLIRAGLSTIWLTEIAFLALASALAIPFPIFLLSPDGSCLSSLAVFGGAVLLGVCVGAISVAVYRHRLVPLKVRHPPDHQHALQRAYKYTLRYDGPDVLSLHVNRKRSRPPKRNESDVGIKKYPHVVLAAVAAQVRPGQALIIATPDPSLYEFLRMNRDTIQVALPHVRIRAYSEKMPFFVGLAYRCTLNNWGNPTSRLISQGFALEF